MLTRLGLSGREISAVGGGVTPRANNDDNWYHLHFNLQSIGSTFRLDSL